MPLIITYSARMSFLSLTCDNNYSEKFDSPFMGCSVSPPSYIEILTPSTSECDFTWNSGINRSNQVKMRSFKWALIQYDWSPNKKGKFGQCDTHGGKKM